MKLVLLGRRDLWCSGRRFPSLGCAPERGVGRPLGCNLGRYRRGIAFLDVLFDVALVALLDVLLDVALVALLDVLLDVALALLDVLLDVA